LILLGFLLAIMNKIIAFFRNLLHLPKKKEVSANARSFISSAHVEMQHQHLQHASNWQYGKEKGWSADLEAGMIVFQFAGERTGTSQFQPIGIYDETDGRFVWAWSQRSLPSSLRTHATMAKHWGQAQRHASFTASSVECSMEEAWEFAAVTRKLAGAHSVYRGRIGSRYIFMTTDEVHINDLNSPTISSELRTKKPNWTKGRQRSSW
jgi:hypothetical protein